MITLLALAEMIAATAAPTQVRQATATVRIERPARVTPETWHRASTAERREVLRRDESGRAILLRLIDFP